MIMTGIGSSCGACKFLRRRCTRECLFAPYFSYEQAATHFAAVHKVFGASNVSKLLLHLPVQWRSEAAVTISYEALARMHDPIYGCVAEIFALQQQVATLKEEIEAIGNQMANLTFDLPSRESFEINNNSNGQLAFWSETINQENCVNQHTPLLSQAGNISASQTLSTHTTVQHPLLNEWKDEPSHLHSNSNVLEAVFEELGKTGYLQNPWTESNTTLN